MKQTKLIATISDLNCEVSFLKQAYQAGMDAIRINTAHQEYPGAKKIINNVRKVSDKIPIIIDTKGPEIRTTHSEDFFVKKGQQILIVGDPRGISSKECICVTYKKFAHDLKVGSMILIDDGQVEFEVVKKKERKLICKVKNSGIIKKNKGVNVPGIRRNLPSLSQRDKDYINFAIDQDIDFIAHSFVRNKNDILIIQRILDKKKSKIKIIAKIENQEGVENLDEILDHVHGIMIARGDLSLEIAKEKIPGIQKKIIKKCIEKKKTVIVATQLLHSMIVNPRPTRAEVSDVANAIYDGTDAVMLSGETAYGAYPIESIKTITNIALEVEGNTKSEVDVEPIDDEISAFLSRAAVKASFSLPVKAIITDTITGRTAMYLSACRGKNPVYSQCYEKRVMRELGLSFGIYARYTKSKTDQFIKETLKQLIKDNKIKESELILILAGSSGPSKRASFIEINKVKNLI